GGVRPRKFWNRCTPHGVGLVKDPGRLRSNRSDQCALGIASPQAEWRLGSLSQAIEDRCLVGGAARPDDTKQICRWHSDDQALGPCAAIFQGGRSLETIVRAG